MSQNYRVSVQRFIEQFATKNRDRPGLLLLPLFIFEGIFFVIPFMYLLRVSLYSNSPGQAFVAGTWTIDSYIDILTSDFIWGVTIFTFKYSAIVTLVTVTLAIGYSYSIWRANGVLKTYLLMATIMALFTTLVVKLYSWVLLLAPIGTLNNILITLSFIDEPLILISNMIGAVVGQIYITFPYAVLPIYSVLTTMDEDVLEAARDLGASRPRSFYEVVLPEAMPGIIVAAVITFTWSVGSYSAPALLGSAKERTFAIEVYNLMLTQFNWPRAGALSVFTILIVVINLLIMYNLLNRREGGINDVQ